MKDSIPREVQVKKAADIQAPEGPQTDGMIRMPAIVDKSDQLCGTGKSSSTIRADSFADDSSDGSQASHSFGRPPPR